jgi:radical SAM superfamily enzyme YgiQ (UPF0313 family)
MPGPQLAHAVPLCQRLKARYPDLTIVWGGYFPTEHPQACLRADYVDYVVRGHGEAVFGELVDALTKGERAPDVPGIATRDPKTSEYRIGDIAPLPHPQELPDFPYHRVDMARYIRPTFMGQRTLPHHSSYGCPFACGFCAVRNMCGGRWLAQSATRTAEVVQGLVRSWDLDAVEFYDNNFFVDERRTAEFAQRIMPLGIGWWAEGRIDTLLGYADQTWATIRDSGLKMVFVGAESGSDETLQRMNKGGQVSTNDTLEFAAKAAAYDIIPEMSFVLGTPPDPKGDAYQTMAFIREVKRVNPQTEIILYMYTPVAVDGGRFLETTMSQGFRFPETLEEWIAPAWQGFAQRRSDLTPWVSHGLRREIRDFERVLNAYYPTATDTGLGRIPRTLLRLLSSWRYRSGVYRYPLELRALQRVVSYQRPETRGF